MTLYHSTNHLKCIWKVYESLFFLSTFADAMHYAFTLQLSIVYQQHVQKLKVLLHNSDESKITNIKWCDVLIFICCSSSTNLYRNQNADIRASRTSYQTTVGGFYRIYCLNMKFKLEIFFFCSRWKSHGNPRDNEYEKFSNLSHDYASSQKACSANAELHCKQHGLCLEHSE